MLNAIFRPVVEWPGEKTPSYKRTRAKFKASYPRRLNLLERELNNLRARDVVIQAFFDIRDIRNDGWPRSSARPKEPGIVVSFHNDKTQMFSYPCDTYDGWEDNLYAIALSLEALRAVDRYGVTKRGEQYMGFRQIEAPSASDRNSAAIRFLAFHSGLTESAVLGDLSSAFRIAARKLHPDVAGASGHALFVQLQDHYRALNGGQK